MPLNRDIYKRFYIMFEPDEKGCSLYKDKDITGYLKIETRGNRGRITAALQNLNPEYSYNVKLLAKDQKTSVVDFGAIKVDDKGRGGGEWTFDLNDVKKTGRKFEEFLVAFIEADDGQNKIIPLANILDKKRFNWKNVYKKYINDNVQTEKDSEESDNYVDDDKNKFNISYTDKEQEAQLQDNFTSDNKKDQDGSFNHSETPSENFISNEEEKIENEINKNENKAIYDIEINYQEEGGYIKYLKEYVSNIINYLEEVHPFEDNIEGYRWWKIDTGYTSRSLDHYLIGFFKDSEGQLKYIAYGIPGFFTLADQPFGGMTGFVLWKPSKGTYRQANNYGYWILHIDAITGQIAIPIEPTPPPII